MHVLAFSSSPRPNANSKALLQSFERGLQASGGRMETVHAQDCKLKPCRGCLRCNLIKRCALKNDDWPVLSEKILAADVLVFAGPIYFHHVAAPLKMILDRFRSFMHVRITEQGLVHTPWHEWKKHFVLLLTMGSFSDKDARPVVELFEFITGVLGAENRLSVVAATGLAQAGQITMDTERLGQQYVRLGLDPKLSNEGYVRNQNFLNAAEELGSSLWKN